MSKNKYVVLMQYDPFDRLRKVASFTNELSFDEIYIMFKPFVRWCEDGYIAIIDLDTGEVVKIEDKY